MMALVIVLSLGLGIGANTAIFSLLYQVILRTLPVEKPQELVVLQSPGEFKGGRNSTNDAGGMASIFSYKMFRGLEKTAGASVKGVAAFRKVGANLSYRGQTVDSSLQLVSGGYFPLLGVTPRMGRLLTPEDDADGGGRPVVVLSHEYWESRLGSDPVVLNQPLRVNGHLLTIVGVVRKGFTGNTFGTQPAVYVPLSLKPKMTPGWDGTDKWSDYWLYLFARLQPGVSLEQAQSALNIPYHALVEEQAANDKGVMASDVPRFRKSRLTLMEGKWGQSNTREEGRVPLLILMASTALVLLIAIANTANLLLARAAQRGKELAIRAALGAGRTDIIRQLLGEAMLLAAAGGVAGVLIAYATVRAIISGISDGRIPEDLQGSLDWPVLVFAIGISLVSGLLCGIFPAWDAARNSVNATLRDQSTQMSASVGASRVRRALVCGQVAISALLLVPTGLFLKSLVNLLRVDLGVRTENLVTFGVSPELNGYKDDRIRSILAQAEEQLAAIPGVSSASTCLVPLIAGDNWGNNVTVEGYSRDPHAETHSMFNLIGPGYFGKLGIPLLAGREFTDRDALKAPKVAIVNERFAKHFFKDGNPIGRRMALGGGPNITLDLEIVGMVKDAHYSSVKQSPPRVYYVPWRQSEQIGSMSFYVRSTLPEEKMAPQIRAVMKSIDPDLPLENMRTMEAQVQQNIRADKMVLQLAAMFAVLATLLAMLGLYGVMAYGVTRRTREIGIRVALGAEPGTIGGMVMGEVLRILAVGLVFGIPAALAVARFTESQLFGVKSFDLGVVVGAIAAQAVAALLAGFLPTRRATRIDPMVALRYE